MRSNRLLVGITLTIAMLFTAPALAREPWTAFASDAASNKNGVYSLVLEPVVKAAASSAQLPDDVSSNCNEVGLPASLRVFVADLYSPRALSSAIFGNDCVVHTFGNVRGC